LEVTPRSFPVGMTYVSGDGRFVAGESFFFLSPSFLSSPQKITT